MLRYPINEDVFLKEDAQSFYLLGAYMTDGNIYSNHKYNQIRINSKDLDWLQSIKNKISPTRSIYKKKNQNLYEFKINSKKIIQWLQIYGCVPNKSKTLSIAKMIPKQYQKEFLLGVLDGDGSISLSKYVVYRKTKSYQYKKLNVYICSGSEKFIKQINFMIPSNFKRSIVELKGRKSKIQSTGQIINGGTTWRIHFNDSSAIKFLTWIYDNNITINLNRKKQLWLDILDSNQ